MAPAKSSARGSGVLYVGRRVRVSDRPQTCGEVVRVMPMTGRIIADQVARTEPAENELSQWNERRPFTL